MCGMVNEAAYEVLELHAALNITPKESLRISGTNNNPLPTLQVVANDKFVCRVRFYTSVGDGLEIRKLDDGAVVQMNAVAYGTNTGDALLFKAAALTLVESEDGTDVYYEGLIDTATVECNNFIGAASEKMVLFSVQVSDALGAGATRRKTIAYMQGTLLSDGYDDDSSIYDIQGTEYLINGGNAGGTATYYFSAATQTYVSSYSSTHTSSSVVDSSSSSWTTFVETSSEGETWTVSSSVSSSSSSFVSLWSSTHATSSVATSTMNSYSTTFPS